VVRTAALSLLLSMIRLLPPYILLKQFNNDFLAGYPDILSILNALVAIQPPGIREALNGLTKAVGLWEVTLYVGSIAALFLLVFGVYRPFTGAGSTVRYRALLFPAAGLVFLSLDKVYSQLRVILPIPLLSGEHVSARMISLAFVLILCFAVIEFQGWLNSTSRPRTAVLAALMLMGFGIHDLWQNFAVWALPGVSAAFPLREFSLAQYQVVNRLSDIPYINLIVRGFALSILSLVFMGGMLWWEKRKVAMSSPRPDRVISDQSSDLR